MALTNLSNPLLIEVIHTLFFSGGGRARRMVLFNSSAGS